MSRGPSGLRTIRLSGRIILSDIFKNQCKLHSRTPTTVLILFQTGILHTFATHLVQMYQLFVIDKMASQDLRVFIQNIANTKYSRAKSGLLKFLDCLVLLVGLCESSSLASAACICMFSNKKYKYKYMFKYKYKEKIRDLFNSDALLRAVPAVRESLRVAPPFDGSGSAGATAVGGKLPKQKVAASIRDDVSCEGGGFDLKDWTGGLLTSFSGNVGKLEFSSTAFSVDLK